jgi:glycosyltransferase involved in cell wall biosynthesis
MRIAHVIHTFPPFSHAGSENYCYTLAREQARRHDVRIFYRIADPRRPEYEVTEDRVGVLPVTRINRTFRDMRSFEETYRSAAVATAFGAFLNRVRPDIVHFHHVTCLSTTCVHEAKARGIPIVYTLHDFWLFCPQGQLLRRNLSVCRTHTDADCVRCMAYQLRLSGRRARVRALGARAPWLRRLKLPTTLYYRLASRPFRSETAAIEQIRARTAHILEMCSLVDQFVAPSCFLRDRYVEFGIPAEKLAFHDYGFDLTGWKQATDPRPEGPLRVIYLGTWIPSKGVHVLIEAFRGLDSKRAVLDVYGYAVPYDGVNDYEGQLRRLAVTAPHIRFARAYTPDALPNMLANADVLVVPSIWYENSPLTIHEAFLAGVPVVTANHGGMAELVKDQVGGLTFEAGNPFSLRRVLRRLIENSALLPELKENIPSVKSIERNADELDAIYRTVASRCS